MKAFCIGLPLFSTSEEEPACAASEVAQASSAMPPPPVAEDSAESAAGHEKVDGKRAAVAKDSEESAAGRQKVDGKRAAADVKSDTCQPVEDQSDSDEVVHNGYAAGHGHKKNREGFGGPQARAGGTDPCPVCTVGRDCCEFRGAVCTDCECGMRAKDIGCRQWRRLSEDQKQVLRERSVRRRQKVLDNKDRQARETADQLWKHLAPLLRQ